MNTRFSSQVETSTVSLPKRKADKNRFSADAIAAASAELQLNAARLLVNGAVIAALEDMIALRIGVRVRQVRGEAIGRDYIDPQRVRVHRRAYTKHWFEICGSPDRPLPVLLGDSGQLVVFVKSAVNLGVRTELEEFLTTQSGRGFRVPSFLGSTEVAGLGLGVWEFVEKPKIRFNQYSSEKQSQLIRAIAGVNSLRFDGKMPIMRNWIVGSPEWFERASSGTNGGGPWAPLYERTAKVLERREAMADRLLSLDQVCLTHGDFGAGMGNALVPGAGDVLILDWESAAVSVPGADLGFLDRSGRGDTLLACYVDQMCNYGFKLSCDDVRFASEAIQGFRSLRRGWVRQTVADVTRGLDLLDRHLG